MKEASWKTPLFKELTLSEEESLSGGRCFDRVRSIWHWKWAIRKRTLGRSRRSLVQQNANATAQEAGNGDYNNCNYTYQSNTANYNNVGNN